MPQLPGNPHVPTLIYVVVILVALHLFRKAL
jgi:hypothetical protein